MTVAEQIEANLETCERNLELVRINHEAVDRYLATVKAHQWRLIRNHRLLRQTRVILNCNRDMMNANYRLLASNGILLDALRAPW